MSTVKENLIAAKALIDTPAKWIKGHLQNADDTCYCAYGAAAAVARARPGNTSDIDHALCSALRSALPTTFQPKPMWLLDIAQFNDAPSTTHADVIALFDRAIAAQDGRS